MEFALQALSQLINNILALDPEMSQRLHAFNGKTLAIEFTNLPIKFYVSLAQSGVALSAESETPPVATIRGSLFTLSSLAWRDVSHSKSLFGKDVEFSGDIEFAQAVKQAFDSLDIDWEEWLATYCGDVMSHEISSALRGIRDTGKRVANSFEADVSEYLTEEARLTPSPMELEDFYHDIATLRDDVDRLALRVQQVLAKGEQ